MLLFQIYHFTLKVNLHILATKIDRDKKLNDLCILVVVFYVEGKKKECLPHQLENRYKQQRIQQLNQLADELEHCLQILEFS